MVRSGDPRRFLTDAETVAIHAAVTDAERSSSAELKVVLGGFGGGFSGGGGAAGSW